MTKQKRLNRRVNEKARSAIKLGMVHRKNNMRSRMSSASKPGSYHDTFLKWHRDGNGQVDGLSASCAWVEPVTGSQTHCPGNGTTVCWHVLASIIAKCEQGGKRVAFFTDEEKAVRYSRFGGCPVRVIGKDVWFVVNGGVPLKGEFKAQGVESGRVSSVESNIDKVERRSVKDDMADLYGDRDTALPVDYSRGRNKMFK